MHDTGSESQLEGIVPGSCRYGFLPLASAEAILSRALRRSRARTFATRSFSGRLYCTERALWKLNWFLRDFGYDAELLGRDQVDEKALLNLRGVVRTSPVTFNGRSYQNLEAFAPAAEWEELSCATLRKAQEEGTAMIFSHTQISQYLRCPRSYRTAISMAGEKRKPVPPWPLADPSKRPWGPTSSGRIPGSAIQGMGCLSGCSVRIQERGVLGPHGPSGSSSAAAVRSG